MRKLEITLKPIVNLNATKQVAYGLKNRPENLDTIPIPERCIIRALTFLDTRNSHSSEEANMQVLLPRSVEARQRREQGQKE